MALYIDASTSPTHGKSVGCFFMAGSGMIKPKTVVLKSKTSTQAELELALYALTIVCEEEGRRGFVLYTDCANIANLTTRRYSMRHNNSQLYDRLKALILENDVRVAKVVGHQSASSRITLTQRVFHSVDNRARKALRDLIKSS